MKLLEALEALEESLPAESPRLDVQLACGFTPLHFLTFLRAHLRRACPGHNVEITPGLFGDLAGNLENIEKTAADAVVAMIEWPDLDPRLGIRALGGWAPGQLDDMARGVRNQAERLGEALEGAASRKSVALSLPTLPIPPAAFAPGWQLSSFESEVRASVAEVACRIAGVPGVRVISPQRLDRVSPPSARWDLRSELATGFPYSLSHADALAGLVARAVRAAPPKKGLITDLDDTFWAGILGEVGVENIAWDLDHHAQRHGLYQQLLASMSEAGVLIGAASKNAPALVDEAFRRLRPMLPRERIFPMEINWGPKSESVARILNAWNVGAESVVFVDDSALELAEVKAAHPLIECRLFPREDDTAAYQLLEDLRDLFGKQALSEEDAIRLDSIRSAQVSVRPGAPSAPERFLQDAEGKLTVRFANDASDPRPLELINKTNQFNLNGRRHTEASWKRYLAEPDAFLAVASYKDKYGPLGKIAVMAGRRKGGEIAIDHWVMSCRAFSRRIEHACLLLLFQRFGVDQAALDFVPTPRNGPARDFFASLTGTAPQERFLLERLQVVEKCPPVYLDIQESGDE